MRYRLRYSKGGAKDFRRLHKESPGEAKRIARELDAARNDPLAGRYEFDLGKPDLRRVKSDLRRAIFTVIGDVMEVRRIGRRTGPFAVYERLADVRDE